MTYHCGIFSTSSSVRRLHVSAAAHKYEVLVCKGKTCRRQGAEQIKQFAKDLALGVVDVKECGCLGNCGNGPNMVLLPDETQLAHMSTPARVVQALHEFCGIKVDEEALKATELRLAGNNAARGGDLEKAISLYTQALELRPSFGVHLLLSNRSGARLAAGDAEGAVKDAEAAVECAPRDFTTAYVRQVEALLRLGQHTQAMQVLLAAVEVEPDFARAPEYHMLVQHVNTALQGKQAAKA